VLWLAGWLAGIYRRSPACPRGRSTSFRCWSRLARRSSAGFRCPSMASICVGLLVLSDASVYATEYRKTRNCELSIADDSRRRLSTYGGDRSVQGRWWSPWKGRKALRCGGLIVGVRRVCEPLTQDDASVR